jgi:GTP-binding protein Era
MEALGTAPHVGAIVPVSAWTADGLRHLISAVEGYLPVGEMAFAPDELTDRPLRYLVAELVREQVFLQIREEVPYGVACETEVYEELEDLSHIQVVVHVEKPAQRAILVGKAGARMKQIATAARLQMEQLCGRKVFLDVHVRIEPSWSERMDKLREFGYLVD